jgi:catechol 2,3-dioxygenase-like lactoylglutathione lyase family enzyme
VTLLVNVDVDDLERGTRFYCDGLGLKVGRRFDGWTELVGAAAPARSAITRGTGRPFTWILS